MVSSQHFLMKPLFEKQITVGWIKLAAPEKG